MRHTLRAEHGTVDYVECPECLSLLEVHWADRGLSYAECDSCDIRLGYKIPYSKFVRI